MAAPVVKLKRSSVPGKVPLTADIDLGEIAINTFDGKAYFKKDDGSESIVEIGTGAGDGGEGGSYTAPTLLNLYNKNNSGSPATFNGTETRFQIRNSSGNIITVSDALLAAVSVDGVIQKPNSGVPTGSFEGFYVITNTTVGFDIVFGAPPTTGADFFGILSGTFIATAGTTGITKLDSITSQFNNVQTSFTLKVNGNVYAPGYINALLISLGGIVQTPVSAYTISGSIITFSSAPPTGTSFYGIDFEIGESTSSQIFNYNAATVTTNADLTGDVTSVGNATAIASDVIIDTDINVNAAIAGTKITPNFGSQTITTTSSIELGHASDTTLSRNAAGVLAVEGITVPTVSSVNTFTNKTLASPVLSGTTTTVTGNAVIKPATNILEIQGDATSVVGKIQLNCHVNTHGQRIASQPHSQAATNTLVLPGGTTIGNTDAVLVSDTGTQTLTNKTLTAPTFTSPALGTPTSGTLTNCTFPTLNQNTTGNAATVTTNANLTGHVTSVGNSAVLGSFTSLELLTALTDETGTGANVFATSPTLVTPALGIPSSGNLTNCTFPILNQSTTGNAATATNATTANALNTSNSYQVTALGIGQAAGTGTELDLAGRYAQTSIAVATLDIDCSLGNYYTKTITTGSTFTFSNIPASRSYSFTLCVTHDSGTITWPAAVKWPQNTAPVLTTYRNHKFMFSTYNGGSVWYGAALPNYSY